MESGTEERLALRAAGHTNAETHSIYTNIDKRLAREIAKNLNELHSKREKKVDDVTDGTEFVS